MRNTLPGSQTKPYREEIMKHGGQEEVAECLLNLIPEEIRELEKRVVSAATFQALITAGRNRDTWKNPMGYISILKDSRNERWWRAYVGQCRNASRRIVRQHAQDILQNSKRNLHHFMLWIGNGNRSTNFVLLWAFPEGTVEDAWYSTRSNILETVFCKAFRTHHGILEPIDAPSSRDMRSFGLNIMSPLVQGGVLSALTRIRANSGPTRSPDRQIRYWPVFRHGQKKQVHAVSARPHLKRDFDETLRMALGVNEDLYASVRMSLLHVNGTKAASAKTTTIPFIGHINARIAFVLDFAATSPANDELLLPLGCEELADVIPWSLRGCHFNDKNSLIWTHDFGSFSELEFESFSETLPNQNVLDWHRSLLEETQAHVILLCGPRAERIIKSLLGKNVSKHTLELRGFEYTMYFQRATKATRHRIYIRTPTLPSESWSTSVGHSARLSEAIRFSVNMIGLTGIRPYFAEASSVVGYILKCAKVESQGGEVLTPENIDAGAKLWLCRKGFTELDDLREIEKLGETFVRGLLMVLHALPRKNNREYQKMPPSLRGADITKPKKARVPEPFDPERFGKVKNLVGDRIKERESKYALRFVGLSPEQPLGSSESLQSSDGSSPVQMGPSASLLEFSRIEDDSPETVAKMRSLLASRQVELTEANLESTVEDLANIINSAVRRGIFVAERSARRGILRKGQVTGKHRGDYGCRDWGNELENLPNKEYNYTVPLGVPYERLVRVCMCPIKFPAEVDVGDGTIFVKVELSPLGQQHPHQYALSATHDDPACRLALRVRIKDTAGIETVYYEQNSNERPLYRANSFVDILNRRSPFDIASTERRYLFYGPGRAPRGLEVFEGGGYTKSKKPETGN
ncbi:hypothetical protein ASPSYDRAFT_1159393 [Aspergillus sydowii CBS 593.65]|uniref:Uncharacterized protein n=1 Tax=Aspergillus sydowii CBS 593.65 TaxID=1036612 RepID=A0A1L9T818_9EURO|nr:uncharacterized protein ASPSYDRAFT_1159393 [Aspergillus sydowii CBS 593.65]OJJ55566.1 hypothetical protein ASPSYDRAFT_1159393 [Aspergillus sydowii CBS 593.65]